MAKRLTNAEKVQIRSSYDITGSMRETAKNVNRSISTVHAVLSNSSEYVVIEKKPLWKRIWESIHAKKENDQSGGW